MKFRSRSPYKAQLAIAPIVLIVVIIIWLLTSCESQKYIINSNFHYLHRGMTEQEFLEWIKPNYIAVNGRPSTVKMFTHGGKEWKVYVFDLYQITNNMSLFDHQEYVAFVEGKLEEYGAGNLPITIRQNPNQYMIINR